MANVDIRKDPLSEEMVYRGQDHYQDRLNGQNPSISLLEDNHPRRWLIVPNDRTGIHNLPAHAAERLKIEIRSVHPHDLGEPHQLNGRLNDFLRGYGQAAISNDDFLTVAATCLTLANRGALKEEQQEAILAGFMGAASDVLKAEPDDKFPTTRWQTLAMTARKYYTPQYDQLDSTLISERAAAYERFLSARNQMEPVTPAAELSDLYGKFVLLDIAARSQNPRARKVATLMVLQSVIDDTTDKIVGVPNSVPNTSRANLPYLTRVNTGLEHLKLNVKYRPIS